MVESQMDSTKEKNKDAFGWFSAIVTLAMEDITKMEKVITKNHIECFNFLTYMIDLNHKRQKELKNVKL